MKKFAAVVAFTAVLCVLPWLLWPKSALNEVGTSQENDPSVKISPSAVAPQEKEQTSRLSVPSDGPTATQSEGNYADSLEAQSAKDALEAVTRKQARVESAVKAKTTEQTASLPPENGKAETAAHKVSVPNVSATSDKAANEAVPASCYVWGCTSLWRQPGFFGANVFRLLMVPEVVAVLEVQENRGLYWFRIHGLGGEWWISQYQVQGLWVYGESEREISLVPGAKVRGSFDTRSSVVYCVSSAQQEKVTWIDYQLEADRPFYDSRVWLQVKMKTGLIGWVFAQDAVVPD